MADEKIARDAVAAADAEYATKIEPALEQFAEAWRDWVSAQAEAHVKNQGHRFLEAGAEQQTWLKGRVEELKRDGSSLIVESLRGPVNARHTRDLDKLAKEAFSQAAGAVANAFSQFGFDGLNTWSDTWEWYSGTSGRGSGIWADYAAPVKALQAAAGKAEAAEAQLKRVRASNAGDAALEAWNA